MRDPTTSTGLNHCLANPSMGKGLQLPVLAVSTLKQIEKNICFATFFVKFLLCALNKCNSLKVFVWSERRKKEWNYSGQIWHILDQMAQAEHTSGTYISTCHTFIAWLESALLYVRYTDTMQMNHHVNTGWMLYLIKLLLQILWQGSEIVALVLPKPRFTELDTDYERVAHEIRLNRSADVFMPCLPVHPLARDIYRYIYTQGQEVTYVSMEKDLMFKILKK